MTLVQLLEIASKGYASDQPWRSVEDSLEGAYDPETGELTPGEVGDTLADFVVAELHDAVSAGEPDQVQLSEAIRVMYRAILDLQGVVNELARAMTKLGTTE